MSPEPEPGLDRFWFWTALTPPCVCSEACQKNPGCDYFFSIDSDVALTNPDTLRILMEENK